MKIVYITKDSLVDTTKKLFLIENDVESRNMPDYLKDFINKEKIKDKNKVYL